MQLMNDMVQLLNKATLAYDEGHPIMSDEEWDNLYFQLVKLENQENKYLPNSPTQRVNYEVVSQLNKIQHDHLMLSLDKTKDWNEFLRYFSDRNPYVSVVGMPKLDGLTCSLTYENGYLVRAETRGDGKVGEDILHNAKVISSIPNRVAYLNKLVVDGEIICTDKDFETFKDEYANSRNFASGSIRLLDSKECANRNLTFVVWNVVEGLDEDNNNSFMKRIEYVDNLGFTIVPWTSSFDWDAKEFLIEQAEELGYPIDGLVGRFDDIKFGNSLGATEHHPRAAYAFKFYDEKYPTKLYDIEWTMGRTGILTPVAIFNAIDVEGTTVERASLHNVSVMRELLGDTPYRSQNIWISKRNMIIPQVEEAEISNIEDWPYDLGYILPMPTLCPVCGGEVRVLTSDSGVLNMYCINPNCEGKLINRLDHFCGKKGLDIKGLSKATLAKLIDLGWINQISDIFHLKEYRTEWIQQPGFGEKSVDKILDSIELSRAPSLQAFISSLGIPLIGNTVAKELVKHISSYEDFRKKIIEKFDFSQYDGFAESKTEALWNFDYTEADIVYNCLTIQEPTNVNNSEEKTLAGLNIVITGRLEKYKNRSELQKEIELRGGKVVGSVSGTTNYLINNDSNSASAKNITAKKLNIPILTEEEFGKLYLNL